MSNHFGKIMLRPHMNLHKVILQLIAGRGQKAASASSDLISWDQSNDVKTDSNLEKIFDMKSTVNQLYQQHTSVPKNLLAINL